MPTSHVEYRVFYVFDNTYTKNPIVYEHTGDTWYGDTPDGAAAYPWLMANTIAWVQSRVVYDPEPWESADVDAVFDHYAEKEVTNAAGS